MMYCQDDDRQTLFILTILFQYFYSCNILNFLQEGWQLQEHLQLSIARMPTLQFLFTLLILRSITVLYLNSDFSSSFSSNMSTGGNGVYGMANIPCVAPQHKTVFISQTIASIMFATKQHVGEYSGWLIKHFCMYIPEEFAHCTSSMSSFVFFIVYVMVIFGCR